MAEKEQLSEALERLERDIDKEVTKLKHYMEPADELIENNDYLEMKIAVKQATQIISKITDLNFTTGNLEAGLWSWTVEEGQEERVFSLCTGRDKISELLSTKQRQRDEEIGKQDWEAKWEREERVTQERINRERNSGRKSSEPSCAWQSKSWRWKLPQRLLMQSFLS